MITAPYTLFIRLPLYQSSDGTLYADDLWAKDLAIHLDYIKHFSICCPIVPMNDIEGLVRVDHLKFAAVHALRQDRGWFSVLRNLVPNFLSVWRAASRTDIVHTDGAGWAFPLSFYLLPISLVRPFRWVIVIESSHWMLTKESRSTLRQRIEHYLHTKILRACLRRADARVFTQSFYRRYFLGADESRSLVNPAVWIDQSNVLDAANLAARHQAKKARRISVFYPSRLRTEKGTPSVLKAIELLRERGVGIDITVMGDGPLARAFESLAADPTGTVRVNWRPPVPYGPEFFAEMRQHDFVLVSNVHQEQPRIVFDAFSQGVGVIGSDTQGIADITGRDSALSFRSGDPADMARALEFVVDRFDLAHEMGLAGLRSLKGRTHRQMHEDRRQFLEVVLSQANGHPKMHGAPQGLD